MTQNYTWKITGVNSKPVDDKEDVVYEAYFTCSKLDEVNQLPFLAVEQSKIELKYDTNNFIAYSDLTEEMILDWVKSALGEKRVNGMQDDVDKQILNAKNKLERKTGLPW